MISQSKFRNSNYDKMLFWVRKVLGIPESTPIKFFPLMGRGSDRVFFRVKWNRKHSVILIQYDPKRLENNYYAEIADFLYKINIPVPRIIHHNTLDCLILAEDLGDTDLWSLRKTSWETRRSIYQKTLGIAHRLHSFPEKDFPSDRVRLMEAFGPDLYRWERNYFMTHFVRDVCHVELDSSFEREIEAELSGLANRLAEIKRSLVHRDFQSQNVMIRNGEPFLIDFQGMRFGNPLYDLASLLVDPYMNLSMNEQRELLSYYYGLSSQGLDWATFQKIFWSASVQRLMQALGAYGFLSLKKGLRSFRKHIPAGLGQLHEAVLQAGSLPQLLNLSTRCQQAVSKKR